MGGGGYVCESGVDGGGAEADGTRVLHLRYSAAGTCKGEADDRGSSGIPGELGEKVGARRRMYHPRRGL